MKKWLETHTHVLIYASFWLGLALYGLAAPPERVALLDSALVTEGWHLSAMAAGMGLPVLWLYWRRFASRFDGA